MIENGKYFNEFQRALEARDLRTKRALLARIEEKFTIKGKKVSYGPGNVAHSDWESFKREELK